MIILLMHIHVNVADLFAVLTQLGQLVIVRRKQRLGMNVLIDVFDHRLSQRHAVIGGCSSSDLIKEDQRTIRSMLKA